MTKDETARTAEKLQEARVEERERSAPSSSGEVVEKLKLAMSSCSNAGSHTGVIDDQRGGPSDEEQNNSPPREKGKTGHSRPLRSVGRCANFARDERVRIRHGAAPSSKSQSRARKKCAVEGCDSFGRSGGVCIRHGATQSRKTCSREGCTNQTQIGGVCTRHGSRRPVCSREGCTSYAQKGGVCARHGASDEGGRANGNALEELVDPTRGVGEKSEKSRGPDDADDGDDEDEMGALTYDSSYMARDWADEIELSSPVYRHLLIHSAPDRPPNSDLLYDNASQIISGDGLSPLSIGDSEDFLQTKSAAKRMASASLGVVAEAKRGKLLPTQEKSAKNVVSSSAASEMKKATEKKQKAKEKEKKYRLRAYNRYNIFFIFEREKIIQSKGGGGLSGVGHRALAPRDAEEESRLLRENYRDLSLPPPPPRFAGVAVSDGWFIPRGQKARRRLHRKTHGGAGTFLSLSKGIAKAWKEVDGETLEWTTAVEKALRQNQMRQLVQGGENHSVENTECHEDAKIEVGIWSESLDAQPAKLAAETRVQSKLPAGTGVVHDDEMAHDNRAPPSPVTSQYESPSSASSEHMGHFEGDPAKREESGAERSGPEIFSSVRPVAPATDRAVESPAPDAARPAGDDGPRSKEEELRTWMADYFENSSAAFDEAAGPANAGAATHEDDAFEELRKYLSVIKCAEMVREKAAREIRQRIVPRLLLPSDSAGGTEGRQPPSQQSGACLDPSVTWL